MKTFYTILFIFLFSIYFCQKKSIPKDYYVLLNDTLNHIDTNGNKQGLWIENNTAARNLTIGNYINNQKENCWNYFDLKGNFTETELFFHGKVASGKMGWVKRKNEFDSLIHINFVFKDYTISNSEDLGLSELIGSVNISCVNLSSNDTVFWLSHSDKDFILLKNEKYKFIFYKNCFITKEIIINTSISDVLYDQNFIQNIVITLSNRILSDFDPVIIGKPSIYYSFGEKEFKNKLIPNINYMVFQSNKINELEISQRKVIISNIENSVNKLVNKLKGNKIELERENQISRLVISQQKIISNVIFISLLLFIIFSVYIFLNLQKNKKQNKLINEQKSILEHQKKEITDSINYSKRIQTAILPNIADIKQNLNDFFILYQPKDIVSGDFYYFNKVNDDVFIAAADCTGHGVPGAFMSLVASKELKIANSLTNSPAQILKHLNNGVKDTLKQNHIDGTKDGMDIALVKINGTTVTYSAANRPLWILKKDSSIIEEIKATKTAIAGFTEDDFEFEEITLNLSEGDIIFLFSDGYADQFGGDKQKKMTTKRFREFVLSIKNKSMKKQQIELENYFKFWQGNTEQVDDLLVIGIKL